MFLISSPYSMSEFCSSQPHGKTTDHFQFIRTSIKDTKKKVGWILISLDEKEYFKMILLLKN